MRKIAQRFCFLLLFFFRGGVLGLKDRMGDEMYINDTQLERFEEGRMNAIVGEMKKSTEQYHTDEEFRDAAELVTSRKNSKWFDRIPKLNLVSLDFNTNNDI